MDELQPTARFQWVKVEDFSGRPAVTEHLHWRDGDAMVLQQWWEGWVPDEVQRDPKLVGEWRDVPIADES